MATNEENDLIGYDPLAWMEGDQEEEDDDEDHLVIDDVDSDNKISISDDD